MVDNDCIIVYTHLTLFGPHDANTAFRVPCRGARMGTGYVILHVSTLLNTNAIEDGSERDERRHAVKVATLLWRCIVLFVHVTS